MEEQIGGKYRMELSQTQFSLSTDSIALADFARVFSGARVCDLGCGCGALGLLLLAKCETLQVTGVEIQEPAARCAAENAAQNGLSQFSVLHGDLREYRTLLPANGFDIVVSNPPYYPPGSGHLRREDSLSIARSELMCPLDALCAAAARALRWGGRFFLVHKPERLTDLLCTLRAHRLEPKRIRLVRHHAGADANLVLIAARRGGKPGVMLEPELLLFTPDGQETTDYRRIYHHQED